MYVFAKQRDKVSLRYISHLHQPASSCFGLGPLSKLMMMMYVKEAFNKFNASNSPTLTVCSSTSLTGTFSSWSKQIVDEQDRGLTSKLHI